MGANRRPTVSPSLGGAVINQWGAGSNIATAQHCNIATSQDCSISASLHRIASGQRQLAWL